MRKKLLGKADFTSGKILKTLFFFILPMAAAQLLQILFNAADIAIVGQFSGENGSIYQAAVGATSSTVHIIIDLFVGLSVGVNVAIANAFGAKDKERQKGVIHTAMLLSVVGGFIVLLIGIFCSNLILQLMNTPANIIRYSTMYMQIYFLGAPFLMIYNFGAALMRGVGETRKPLLYLLVAGVLNIIINIITVVCFDMHVIGVALGTVISQAVSAVWIVIDLMRGKYGVKLSLKNLKFYKKELKYILYIGTPMGASNCCFSLSNLFVQSAINGYGDMLIAGNTIAQNIYMLVQVFTQSTENGVVTAMGQNAGAKKPERFNRIVGAGLFLSATFLAAYTLIMLLAGRYVCMIFNTDPIVIEFAMKRMLIVNASTLILAFHFTFGGALRGMGYSIIPMIINLFFTSIVRIIYLFIIYPFGNVTPDTLPPVEMIYIIYPITWAFTAGLYTLMYFIIQKKIKKKKALASASVVTPTDDVLQITPPPNTENPQNENEVK